MSQRGRKEGRKEGRKQKMGSGAGRGKFKGKPTGRRHFSTPEEMGMLVSQPFCSFLGWLARFVVCGCFCLLSSFLSCSFLWTHLVVSYEE